MLASEYTFIVGRNSTPNSRTAVLAIAL